MFLLDVTTRVAIWLSRDIHITHKIFRAKYKFFFLKLNTMRIRTATALLLTMVGSMVSAQTHNYVCVYLSDASRRVGIQAFINAGGTIIQEFSLCSGFLVSIGLSTNRKRRMWLKAAKGNGEPAAASAASEQEGALCEQDATTCIQ